MTLMTAEDRLSDLLKADQTTKVYSYARFSTPEQAKGDSFRRQNEEAERWASSRGLVLDDSLSILDEGVSAYRGSNATEGELGAFLQLCQRGLIDKGSILLVESLDRLSRMEPLYAQQIFSQIVMGGVTIVTLSDKQEYSLDSLRRNPMGLMVALMVACRAHEESATKGRRVAAAWAERRRKVAAGEVKRLTRRGPTWLQPEGEGWREDQTKADIVRRVFALTLQGVGEATIARRFNEERVPVLGRGKMWHKTAISKLLRTPAVIGTLTPGYIEFRDGRRSRQFEAPIPHAFPAVISEADWLAVRALKDGRAAPLRGRHANSGVRTAFAGLARCVACGSAMTRVYKGSAAKGGLPKFVCTKAKLGAGCPYVSVPIHAVERALLSHWGDLLADVPAGDDHGHLDKAYSAHEASVRGTEDLLEDLVEALARSPSRVGAIRVARVEAELRLLRQELEELDERRRLADRGLLRSRLGDLVDLLGAAEEAGPDLPRLNAAMKVVFSGVIIDHVAGRLRFQWRQGGETDLIYAWRD